MSTSLYQGATENKVSSISVHQFLRYSVDKILETYIQTIRPIGRHFQKIVKSCSGYPKTCKSVKNRKSIIFFTIPILSSYIYNIEENKNQNMLLGLFFKQEVQFIKIPELYYKKMFQKFFCSFVLKQNLLKYINTVTSFRTSEGRFIFIIIQIYRSIF